MKERFPLMYWAHDAMLSGSCPSLATVDGLFNVLPEELLSKAEEELKAAGVTGVPADFPTVFGDEKATDYQHPGLSTVYWLMDVTVNENIVYGAPE